MVDIHLLNYTQILKKNSPQTYLKDDRSTFLIINRILIK